MSTAARKKSRVASVHFRSHRDCFVHGVFREWSQWLHVASVGGESLRLVMLEFPSGLNLVTLFSSKSCQGPGFPNEQCKKDAYLEIGVELARCLSLMEEDGKQVVIKSLRESDVVICDKAIITPLNPGDHEVMMLNKSKFVADLMKQARVISSLCPFLFWVNNQAMQIKLVKSEPPAKWVLLVDGTKIEVRSPPSPRGPDAVAVGNPIAVGDPVAASTAVSNQPRPLSTTSSTAQSGSDFAIQAGSSMPFVCTPSSTVDREDSEEEAELANGPQEPFSFSAISAQLAGLLAGSWSNLMKGRISPEPTSTNAEKHQKKNATYPAASGGAGKDTTGNSPRHKRTGSQPLSTSMTTGGGGGNSHRSSKPGRHVRRQSSSSVLTQDDVVQPMFATPDLLACLRVQDVGVRGEEELDWNLGQCLDAFVHPASLPDLYHELQFSQESLSCIVQITAIGTAAGDAGKNVGSAGVVEDSESTAAAAANPYGRYSSLSSGRSSSLGSASVDPTTSGPPSQVSSPVPSMDASGAFQPESPWKEENSHPPFVTARLCFASSLRLQRHYHEEGCGEECSVTGATEEVLPGHVVLSDVLKMRLQIGSNGRVLLNKVLDQWRVIYPFNATFKYISISPLSETHSEDMTAGFKHLVEECNRHSPFGFTFTENAIVPIPSCGIAESETNLCISILTKHWIALTKAIAHPTALERLQYSRFISLQGRSHIDSIVDHPDEEKAGVVLNEVKEAVRGNKNPKSFLKSFCQQLIKIERLKGVGDAILREINQSHLVSSQDAILCRLSCQSYIYPKPPHSKCVFQLMRRDVNHLSCKMSPTADKRQEQENLDPPRVAFSLDQFGGMDKLFEEGTFHLMSLLRSRATEKALLVCGTGTKVSGSGGCGKTSLAKLLCREAARSDLRAHFVAVQCKMLRGKRLDLVFKALAGAFAQARKHGPSVLLLDDLDQIMENIGDDDIEVERRLRSYKSALFLIDCFQATVENVVVVATASSKSTLNAVLLNGRGNRFFSKIVEIPPPSLVDREEILSAIARSRDTTLNLIKAELRVIALRTEGYQAEDLSVLVERAIRQSYFRQLQPKADSLPLAANRISVATLTGASRSASRLPSKQAPVTFADFAASLEGYVPAALRGLNVHLGMESGFESVGGLEGAKQTLRETLLWPSKYPRLFSRCPIKQHMGVLLYGAPGTGKTLLAGAVAKEFGLNFVSIKGPEVLNKYIGMSEQAIRDLFARAQSARPCILFFDEFDSLVPLRGRDNTGVTDRVVNQLLTELDGVELLQGVYILAATSRPDLIDPALLRPGRIDKRLLCEIPNEEERESILVALSQSLSKADDIDLKIIASKTDFFTGADLKALLYNATVLAANRALRQEGEYDQILTSGFRASTSLQPELVHRGRYSLEPDQRTDEDDSTPIVSPKTSPLWHPEGGSGGAGRTSTDGSFLEHFATPKDEARSTPDRSRSRVAAHSDSRPDRVGEMVLAFSAKDGFVRMDSSQKLREQEKGMVRRASLRALKMKRVPAVFALLKQEDLLEALEDTGPSLSPSEREKYMRIYKQVAGDEVVSLKDVVRQVITHA